MQFKFELPKECLKHDKEMSYYNHNYYHINFSILGDERFYIHHVTYYIRNV